MQDTTNKSKMLNYALHYLQHGWAVFPVHWIKNGKCSCRKNDCSSPGKHPIAAIALHGCREATTDQNVIRRWWAKHPFANLAVATGKESGFFVVDVDLPEGAGSLENLEIQHGKLPKTVEQITGGGGRHLFFRYPGIAEIRNSTGKLGTKLDIRGEGGYIVVAPSSHHSGNVYTWRSGHGPQEISMAEAPQWLIDLLKIKPEPLKGEIQQHSSSPSNAQTTSYGIVALEGEIRALAGIPEGQRNDALNKSAFRIGQLVSSEDISLSEAENALITAGEQMELTSKEVQATVNSGLKKGMANPRTTQNSDTTKIATNKSESPRPLVREIPPGGDYPVEALGKLLGEAVRAVVDIVQVPAALAAGSVLATASLATQGFADVVLPIGEGRPRPLSLYLLTIAQSSDRKTTADGFALGAVKKREAILGKEYRENLKIYQDKKTAYDCEKDNILKRARKNTTPSAATVETISDEISALGHEPQSPLLPSLTIQEPTIEGLAKLLLLGRPSLGLFSTEGAQMITGYGMRDERKLATAGGFSMLWDGETFKRTRITDGNYALPGRRITMHLMVQPEVGRRLLSDPELADQGMVSRVLVAAPVSLAGTRLYKELNETSLAALRLFEEKIAEILQKKLPIVEGTQNELKPRGLPFSEEAKAVWIFFADEMEREIGPGRKFEQIKAFAGKLAEHAARIAGILTLMEDFQANRISEAAMENGCTLAKFYAEEALRLLYVGLTTPELSEAQKLLDWLHKQDRELVCLPEIYQRGPNSIREKAKAKQLVKILEDHGWLNPLPDGAEIQEQFRRDVWKIVRPGI